MNLTAEKKLSVIEAAPCFCVNTDKIDAAWACNDANEYKAAVEKVFKKYILKAGLNRFQCKKCDKPFPCYVGDDESPAEKVKGKKVKAATPVAPPTVHYAVSPEILKLAKAAARENDFRHTVSLSSYQTMDDWLQSVGRYDLDFKELAKCHKIILRGGQCTREQISATLRRNIHREWNIEALEETFSGLAQRGLSHSTLSSSGTSSRELAKLLTAQQVCDLIEKKTEIVYKPDSIRQLAVRGKLVKHPTKPNSYFLFSVLDFIESLHCHTLSRYSEETQQ